MAPPKRLVLCVEGEGDVAAAPLLVKRLLTELQAWDCVWLDPNPLRVGGVTSLFGRKADNWSKKLQLAAERGGVGAVLLLQDGDVGAIPGQPFCAATLGRDLVPAPPGTWVEESCSPWLPFSPDKSSSPG